MEKKNQKNNLSLENDEINRTYEGYQKLTTRIITDAVFYYIKAKRMLCDDYQQMYKERYIKNRVSLDEKTYQADLKRWEKLPFYKRGPKPILYFNQEDYDKRSKFLWYQNANYLERRISDSERFFKSKDFTTYTMGRIHPDWIYQHANALMKLTPKSMCHYLNIKPRFTLEDGIGAMTQAIKVIMSD